MALCQLTMVLTRPCRMSQSAPTLEAVPGRKVRFDPERHALVRRSSLEGVDLKTLPRRIALEWFVRRSPFDDVVLLSRDDPKYCERDRDDLGRFVTVQRPHFSFQLRKLRGRRFCD